MFDKFGEFNTAEELNNKALEIKSKTDKDGLIALATENGIDAEDAEDFYSGDLEEFVNSRTAAFGKLKVEESALKSEGIVGDWQAMIAAECMHNEEMQVAVRRKDRCMIECLARLLRFAFENKAQINEKIVNATRVTHNGKEEPMRGPVYLGIPNRTQTLSIIRDYYLG